MFERKDLPPDSNALANDTAVGIKLIKWSRVYFWLGLLGSAIAVILAGYVTKDEAYDKWGGNGFSWVYISLAIGSFLQGVFISLLLKGFAEIIRLLNKL